MWGPQTYYKRNNTRVNTWLAILLYVYVTRTLEPNLLMNHNKSLHEITNSLHHNLRSLVVSVRREIELYVIGLLVHLRTHDLP